MELYEGNLAGADSVQTAQYAVRNTFQQRGGQRQLHMKFAGSAVSPYERNVILENKNPVFIDMYAVRNGTDLDVYYKMTESVSLSTYIKKRKPGETEILKITAEVLRLMKSCEDYLMFPEYIPLKTDYIFIHGKDEKIRLMYLPGYRTTRPLKMLLVGFLDDAVSLRRGGGQEGILAEYKRRILTNEYGVSGYINAAEDLIRESAAGSDAPGVNATDYGKESDPEAARVEDVFSIREDEKSYMPALQENEDSTGIKEKIMCFIDRIFF